MQEKIVLSIGLLASNRKNTIEKCLESLTPIRNAIPSELIIIDTGCEKEVRAILENYADVLQSFTWCNDFSKARNETLKYAHGEWYLYLDDDEWFADSEELIAFFQSGEYKAYGYASYIQRNYLDMQASQYTDSWVSRMIKLTPEVHFESKIHEYLVPASGNVKGLHTRVEHFGYVFETEEALWKHYERNRVLLEEMIAEQPQNLRWYIQLAQEYRTVQEWDRLYQLSENGLQMVANETEMYSTIFLGSFYAGKLLSLKEWGKREEALQFCKEALQDKRNVELFQAFAELQMTGFCYWLGRYEEALQHSDKYWKWKHFFDQNEPLFFLQSAGPFLADTFDIVMQKEVYSICMCVGLRQGDSSYLRNNFSKLEWNGQHLYVFEDMVQSLIFAMNRWNRGKLENLFEKKEKLQQSKKMISEIGIVGTETVQQDFEIYKMVLHTMYNHSALWQYFCQELTKIEEQGQNVHAVMELIRTVLPEAIEPENTENTEVLECTTYESQEMAQLAKQIKEQLQMLMQNGMYQEAKNILEQLRKLLPHDKELEKLEEQIGKTGN